MKIEIDINERTIIEGLIDEVNTEYIQKATDSHLENTDFTEYVESSVQGIIDDSIVTGVEDFMSSMDLSDYFNIDDHIDTDDIRYSIEDDILGQVNDHLDYDSIRYNIEDDITESVFSGFDIDDHIDYNIIKEGLEYDELEERVEALENQLEELQACVSMWPNFESPRKVGLIRRVFRWLW